VLVVAEQHRIDRSEVGNANGRPGHLAGTRAPAEVLLPAWAVEGRIGQQSPAIDLDQDGRAADVGEPDSAHVQHVCDASGYPALEASLPEVPAAWATAQSSA
jgi:hypothetical protein